MNRTRLLLGSALTLSLVALVSFVTKPRPSVAPRGTNVVAKQGALKLELNPSHTAVSTRGSEVFAELVVTLEGEAPLVKDAPVAMALVLDVSGSMSGQKLEDARRAAHRLVELLTERDELAVVSFGSEVQVFERRPVNEESRAFFHHAIDGLAASGSTNISGGLEAGWRALRGAGGGRRLVLVSDGQPTVGLVTHPELANLVGLVHDDAITVTALGVGSDIDGPLMTHLAERGGGMYGYLQDAAALEELLGREVDNARRAVGRNVVLELVGTDFTGLEVPGRHVEWAARGPQLHLADLRPGVPTRVLLRLQSRPGEEGVFRRLEAQVRARMQTGGVQQVSAGLNLVAVEDEDTVLASREESVFTRGVSAAGSARLVLAAAAYERGDDSAARSLLDDARSVFGMSADALAGQQEADSMRSAYGKADGKLRKDLARGLERKKLSDFGRENEGY